MAVNQKSHRKWHLMKMSNLLMELGASIRLYNCLCQFTYILPGTNRSISGRYLATMTLKRFMDAYDLETLNRWVYGFGRISRNELRAVLLRMHPLPADVAAYCETLADKPKKSIFKWTKAKPTRQGFYWYRDSSGSVFIVEMFEQLDDLFVYFAYGSKIRTFQNTALNQLNDCEWAGPIPEPN